MADAKVSSLNPNKLAMSRALGAAFLNHQVEQLERTVSGTNSGNWRERRNTQPKGFTSASPGAASKRGPVPPGGKVAARKDQVTAASKDKVEKSKDATRRRSSEEETREKEKDADIVVVDASVLVHALYKVKKWCKEGREEIVIVPLEALNTLDLLKKGNSSLAQKARAASRILEAQVGTNPRIRVQRDDAFVLWDAVSLKEDPSPASSCPEWVRRVVCCAQWVIKNVDQELKDKKNTAKDGAKVVLAILSPNANLSPQAGTLRLEQEPILNPVPLPAPNPLHSKHEPRSSGFLVSSWAGRAGIDILEVEPTLPGRGASSAEDDDHRPKRTHHPRARRSSNEYNNGKAALVERPPAVMAMMELVAQPSKTVRVLARGEKLEPDS